MLKMKFFLVLILTGMLSKAQSDPVNPVAEIIKLKAIYNDTTKLSFTCTFYTEDIDTTTVRDTVSGSFKLSGDKYWLMIDSVEQLQDDLYNVTAYHEQQTLLLHEMIPPTKNVLQTELMDSVFLASHVLGITVSDSAAFRTLIYEFNDNAVYLNYKMQYDTATYRINLIDYTIRKNIIRNVDIEETFVNYKTNVKIVFSNYQTGAFTDSAFSSSKFLVRKNGVLTTVTPYTNYELINFTNQ